MVAYPVQRGSTMSKPIKMTWKINTKGLIREIMNNPNTLILKQPLQILHQLLLETGKRALELDDPKMNCWMLRLGLYSIGDPESPDFNPEVVAEYLKEHEQ